MLGVPCSSWMWTESAAALNALALALPLGSVVIFSSGPSTIAANRSAIVSWFVEDHPDLEWLLFCDSDSTPPPHTLAHLWATGKDVVSAMVFCRSAPYPLGAQLLDGQTWLPATGQGLLEVEAVGFHCVLIRRRVLAAIGGNWFHHTDVGAGEDYFFCAKARAAGFRMWINCGLEVGHLATVNITKDFVRAYNLTSEGRRAHMNALREEPRARPPISGDNSGAR